MFLLTTWFGAFLVEGDRIVDERLFPRDARALAGLLERIERGDVLDEEKDLARRSDAFTVAEERLARLPGARLALDADASTLPDLAGRASDWGFTTALLHDASLVLARASLRHALAKRDLHVLQSVDAIDEVMAQANILSERLREWFGLHFPELADSVARHEEFAALINQHGNRERIVAAKPELAPADPMGGTLGPAEEEAIKALARVTANLYGLRGDLEKYLTENVAIIAPNVTILVGPLVAARLLKSAGGLARLASMPAGTIQTLGAEKALFRHIREGKKPPKHGHLFQVPTIHRAGRHQRGALARTLAAKVALAARADAFTQDKTAGARLLDEFEARAREIAAGRKTRPRRTPDRRGPPERGGGFRREGGFRPREERGGFRPREGGRPFAPREERGGFRPAEAAGDRPFRPREDRGGFRPREDRGGYTPREGGFRPREGGGFRPREDRGGFRPREGGFRPREGGGDRPYRPRDDRGPPPSREGGFRPREGGGDRPYRPREDRGGGGDRPGKKYDRRRGGDRS
ncbi:MAG TPA: hypothetical protein VM889_02380 [Candidatus Thermoplasmatota archaeon]|nr:hypothetical protein [Candidatus Thermoplasmatota archaeon]